jgi:hypothetical protein
MSIFPHHDLIDRVRRRGEVMVYWVVGGEYADTKFDRAAAGKSLERHGPFASYDEAHHVWSARAWATVDDCNCRFRLVEGSEDGPGTGPSLAEGAAVKRPEPLKA